MRTRSSFAAPVALAAAAAAILSSAGSAAAQDPAGNNGTVKVDRVVFEDHPDNEPHVGCTFQIDWYGFDEGEDLLADVTFEAVAPTGQIEPLLSDSVFIGEDGNEGAGSEAGLDASATYDLSEALASVTPHPLQGWHVKLTVHADGSRGADTKFKVFWVSGCTTPPISGPPTTPPTSTPETPPAVPPTPGESTTTTVAITPGGGPGTPGTPGSPGGPADPTPSTPPVTVEPTSSGGTLPVTGSDLHAVLVAAWLVVMGGAAIALAKRLRARGS